MCVYFQLIVEHQPYSGKQSHNRRGSTVYAIGYSMVNWRENKKEKKNTTERYQTNNINNGGEKKF